MENETRFNRSEPPSAHPSFTGLEQFRCIDLYSVVAREFYRGGVLNRVPDAGPFAVRVQNISGEIASRSMVFRAHGIRRNGFNPSLFLYPKRYLKRFWISVISHFAK